PSGDEPGEAAELADSLTFAFLVMLDELDAIERAVVLLHDVFGYHFDEIASTTGRSPAACRQIASRARRRLRDSHIDVRRAVDAHERRMIDAYIHSTLTGDVEALMALLSDDVVLISDGGAAKHAARRPVVGPERVARLVMNIAGRFLELGSG